MSGHAEILAIGDELLHGGLLDTNSKWIALELEAHGIQVQRLTVTGDDPALLEAAIRDCCARADLVVATGGLGPTLDDRTREAAAAVAGVGLRFDPGSWDQVRHWLEGRGRPVPESNRRQAHLPEGAVALANAHGTAPGFRMRIGRAEFFAFPGVPREMQPMVHEHVLPHVLGRAGRVVTAQHLMRLVGPSEALLGERIEPFMVPGRNPAVGVTASHGLLTIRIVATAPDAEQARALCAATRDELHPLVAEWTFAEGNEELAALVVQRLAQAGRTLALAESCTAGLVAARLGDVSGASAVFKGSAVAYANEAKTALLGVDPALIAAHGAVSEPVAAAMAAGAAQRLHADLACSITGIAGPGGGTPQKPVGTVCFGCWDRGQLRTWTLAVPNLGRAFVRERALVEVFLTVLRATANKS